MALSGGPPTINTFRGSGKKKKNLFPANLESSSAGSPRLVWILQAGGCIMKLYLCDPGVWKCPHGHVDFSLSSPSLCIVCLNPRLWHRSADAPGLRGLHSKVLLLRLLKVLTKKLFVAVLSSLCCGRTGRRSCSVPNDQGNIGSRRIQDYWTWTQRCAQ